MHTTTTTTTTTHHPHAHPGTPPHHQHQHQHQHRHPEHAVVHNPHRTRRRTFRRFAAGAAALALAAAGALAAAPGTAHADSHRDGQWYLDDFNMNKVHQLSQGEGVTIGIIDEGIDTEHPDLNGIIEQQISFDKSGPIDKAPTVQEGHTTAVASVLAGHGHGKNNQDGILGIAPKAKIVSVDIFAKSDKPHPAIVADAITWLVKQDVNIIVVPGSSGAPGNGIKALETANDAGVAVVASAGNRSDDPQETSHESTAWPASGKGAIPVSGTNQNHKFWEDSTDLSNAAPQPQLGLSAPGVDIPIAMPNGKYDTVDGTSFSAPIVAGTLALIKSAYPHLGARQVNERLILTTDDKGPEGFDDKYGWGIVNPYKALTANVDHHEGKPTSEKDLTPLDQQGDPVDNHPPDTTQGPAVTPNPDDEAAAEAPGPPAWLTIAIITAGALLTAALITLVITKTRRGKKNQPPQTNGPLPPADPYRQQARHPTSTQTPRHNNPPDQHHHRNSTTPATHRHQPRTEHLPPHRRPERCHQTLHKHHRNNQDNQTPRHHRRPATRSGSHPTTPTPTRHHSDQTHATLALTTKTAA